MEWHDDDRPVGRVLSRREMLTLLGGSSAVVITGIGLPRLVTAQDATPSPTPLPSCVVKPEVTEGPYFVDDQLNRFDIRVESGDGSIKAGTPLHLIFRVMDVTGGTCAALEGAQVDIWHCDALGVYSGVSDPGFDTSDQKWLRGYQITDENGVAEFLTTVPGWYPSRAVHIHFKIRTPDTDGQSYEFTSQLFFDPDQIEIAYVEDPYADRGLPNTPNDMDNIYQQTEGQTLIDLVALNDDELEELGVEAGYVATFEIGLDLSDAQVGAADSAGGGGWPSGGNGRGGPGGTPPGAPPSNG